MIEEIQQQLEETKSEASEYLRLQIDLHKLQLVKSMAKMGSLALKVLIFGGLLFFILFFGTLALALLIDAATGIHGFGFGLMALIFVCAMATTWAMRKKVIEKPVIRALLAIIFPSNT